jgi:hypothetical protein
MIRLFSRHRTVAALVLAVVLAASSSPALAAPARPVPPVAAGLLEQLWSLWAGLWSPAAFMDNGCHLDPSGSCVTAPSPDAGCHADPNGVCVTAPSLDAGCHLDPNGVCLPGS